MKKKQPAMKLHYKRDCDCQLCKTSRKYKRIISKLPPEERAWMDGFYNAAFEKGAELEMLKANQNG